MSGFPYIFTFYSYKGGVGRSMALLNSAYTLASWGRHVLIVDMDLEAPGLSGFLDRHQELVSAPNGHPLDILALLAQVVAEVKAGKTSKEVAAQLPPLDGYLRSVAADKLQPLAPKLGAVGRLDILAADMNRNWCDRLSSLGLSELPQDRLISVSSALHFYFKAHRFQHRPYGLEDFELTESTPYDYILIDSRTGITEVGGLCVGPLADRLVVLSSLNDQNIQGTLAFLQEAGIKIGRRNDQSSPWDEADSPAQAEAPALGPKPTILVASPVPNGEIEFKKKRLTELENKIGIRPARLSYHPQMALMESVFVRDYRDEYLAREYLELAGRLIRQVSDYPAQILARTQNKDEISALIVAVLKVAPQEPDLAVSLLTQLLNSFEPQSDSDFFAARRAHAILAALPEFRTLALSNWGTALLDQAKTKQGEEADRLFGEACAKYAEAVRIKPDYHDAFFNWGNVLLNQAETKQGEEADRLFGEACAKYAEAVRIKPEFHDAFSNWGTALSDQARTKQGGEADCLFGEACAKYAEAVRIKPDFHDAFFNWGGALLDQTKCKHGQDADRLFEEACAKYAEAVRIKPDLHEAFFNWGITLSDQAKTKQGEEADRFFGEACAKYAEAVRIKPDYHDAFFNWGNVLLNQARTKQGEEADRFFKEAHDKFMAAEAIQRGSAAYNLACLNALTKNLAESIRWLRAAVDGGENISAEKLAEDPDFDGIRKEALFRSFIRSLNGE